MNLPLLTLSTLARTQYADMLVITATAEPCHAGREYKHTGCVFAHAGEPVARAARADHGSVIARLPGKSRL